MTDSEDRDPIAAAFDGYRRPPADVVPSTRSPGDVVDAELAAIAGQSVTVVHYDLDDDGITKYTELVTVTRPIINPHNNERTN